MNARDLIALRDARADLPTVEAVKKRAERIIREARLADPGNVLMLICSPPGFVDWPIDTSDGLAVFGLPGGVVPEERA